MKTALGTHRVVVAEPDTVDPVAPRFDADGRSAGSVAEIARGEVEKGGTALNRFREEQRRAELARFNGD